MFAYKEIIDMHDNPTATCVCLVITLMLFQDIFKEASIIDLLVKRISSFTFGPSQLQCQQDSSCDSSKQRHKKQEMKSREQL